MLSKISYSYVFGLQHNKQLLPQQLVAKHEDSMRCLVALERPVYGLLMLHDLACLS